jgi:hypothetical protein
MVLNHQIILPMVPPTPMIVYSYPTDHCNHSSVNKSGFKLEKNMLVSFWPPTTFISIVLGTMGGLGGPLGASGVTANNV